MQKKKRYKSHFPPDFHPKVKLALEHVHVEMKAGDMLFFHCNLLHTSNQNNSDLRRWVFIVAFNKKANDPYMDHHHPRYTPLKMVSVGEGWEREEGVRDEGREGGEREEV